MKTFLMTAAVLLATASATTAFAQDEDNAKFRIGVTGGSLGVGPEVGFRFSETIGIRGNVTFLSVNREIESDDITYDSSLKLQSGGLMVDVYPFGGGFFVSGGARINGNRAEGTGEPNAGTNFEIDGTTYTAAQIGTLTAETDVKSVAPSLTLGYNGGLSKGLVFGIEAGALFQGSVKVKPLTITGLCAQPSAPTACATLAADLEAERLSVNDDLDGYKVYPILQLSISYRF